MRLADALLSAFAVAVGACTFGSLADFTVQTCTAASSQSADVCDRLNKGDTTTCSPWQCDGASGACVQKQRDDDRDGDPPIACGGDDCDDDNPQLSSLKVATAVQGATVSLGSATPTLSYDGVTPMVAFAATNNGVACLTASLATGSDPIGACTANVLSKTPSQPYDPAQPYAVAVDPTNPTDVATAFVATTGCAAGSIGFDYVSAAAEVATARTTCSGAAFPSLALTQDGQAAVAYYATPVMPFASGSPLAACPTLSASPLDVALVDDINQPTIGDPIELAPAAKSVSPPAVFWSAPTLFIASPSAGDATLWALDASLATKSSLSIPSLANARQVAMGAYPSGNTTHLALLGALGCTGQSIHLALVEYDGAKLSLKSDVEVSPASTGFKDGPSVAWSSARSRWLTTWIASGPAAFGRFIDAAANPSESEFQIAAGAFGIVALANATAIFVSSTGNGSDALSSSEVRCP